jgi:hypothetical protein
MINQPQQVDPLTGMPLAQPLADQQIAADQQIVADQQIPSNEMGNARPVFDPVATANGNNIYRSFPERQSTMIR